MLRAGEYRNASEAIGDALGALRREAERLRREVAVGVDALDRGAFDEIGDEELDAFLDDLAAPPH
jgi:Arc/MetJ-type ribon-helix-helix transcriptional regulator